MQRPQREDREALAGLLHSLRSDWDRWLILSVLQSHPDVDLSDLIVASVRCAQDPQAPAKAIGWRTRYWSGLDTAPVVVADGRRRCSVCGKPERRCLTERPGPDDHPWSPSEPQPIGSRA